MAANSQIATFYGASGQSGSIAFNNISYFQTGSDMRATGNITAYYSDERLKTKTGNIVKALDKVSSLESFYYVENELAKSFGFMSNETQVALSAQQVQQVLPECVSLAPFDLHTDKYTGLHSSISGEHYLTIDYGKMVPLLVAAIQELKEQIEVLKNAPT